MKVWICALGEKIDDKFIVVSDGIKQSFKIAVVRVRIETLFLKGFYVLHGV